MINVDRPLDLLPNGLEVFPIQTDHGKIVSSVETLVCARGHHCEHVHAFLDRKDRAVLDAPRIVEPVQIDSRFLQKLAQRFLVTGMLECTKITHVQRVEDRSYLDVNERAEHSRQISFIFVAVVKDRIVASPRIIQQYLREQVQIR